MIKKIVTACISVLALSGASTADEVVNLLYDISEKSCQTDGAGGGIDGVKEFPSHALVLALHQEYPIVPAHECEFDMKQAELLRTRVAPSMADARCGYGTNRTNLLLSDTARFSADKIEKADPKKNISLKKDDTALRFRRALLRIFEAAYSGGANGFLVVPNNEAPLQYEGILEAQISRLDRSPNDTNLSWAEFVTRYVPLKVTADDDLMLRLFLDAGYPSPPVRIVCTDAENRPAVIKTLNAPGMLPENFVLASSNSTDEVQWVTDIVQTLTDTHTYRKAGDEDEKRPGSIKGKFRVLKDRTQFTAVSPAGATIGTKFNLDASNDQSTVTADIAIGYPITIYSIDERRQDVSGLKWDVIPYFSFDQDPAEVAVLDADNPTFADGSQNLGSRNIAFADVKGGLRVELERLLETCTPFNQEVCLDDRLKETTGLRRPSSKVTADLSYFTDNYLDIQGVQYELGVMPGFLSALPGYRSPSSILGRQYVHPDDRPLGTWSILNHGRFKWDTTFVVDRLEYARAPRNNKTLIPGDRVSPPDAVRAGIDANFVIQWGNIFALPNDTARFEFGGKYAFREPDVSGVPTIRNYDLFLKWNDTQNKNFSLSLTYGQGRGNTSLLDYETIGIEAGTKF